VYIFDRRHHHHLCELAPSYERRFMGSQWESSDDDDDFCTSSEEIDDWIREGDRCTDDWSYVHVGDVERSIQTLIKPGCLPPEGKVAGGYPIINLVSVTTEDAIREIEEWACTNGEL
jgi:hypothetical protein